MKPRIKNCENITSIQNVIRNSPESPFLSPFSFRPPINSTPHRKFEDKCILFKQNLSPLSVSNSESDLSSVVIINGDDNETVTIDSDTVVKNLNYTFSMLQTDDSTDDESNHEQRGRPPPPAWSDASNRKNFIEYQAMIPYETIDNFFDSKPTRVDLREIFPCVNTNLLGRRESSFGWNTMVNHSRLPSYL